MFHGGPRVLQSFPKPFQPFLLAHLNSMWQPSTLRTTIQRTAAATLSQKQSLLSFLSSIISLQTYSQSYCSWEPSAHFHPLKTLPLGVALRPQFFAYLLDFQPFFLAPFHCFVIPADSQEQSLLGIPQLPNLAKTQNRQQKNRTPTQQRDIYTKKHV